MEQNSLTTIAMKINSSKSLTPKKVKPKSYFISIVYRFRSCVKQEHLEWNEKRTIQRKINRSHFTSSYREGWSAPQSHHESVEHLSLEP